MIEWVTHRFPGEPSKYMQGLNWGEFYEEWGSEPYNGAATAQRVEELLVDPAVNNKKNIYEYLLGGEEKTQLLDLRLFDRGTKQKVYNSQTEDAKQQGKSNCPDCALSTKGNQSEKIYSLKEMEADHATAWSQGGSTTEDNCVMLCKRHNRAKGNK